MEGFSSPWKRFPESTKALLIEIDIMAYRHIPNVTHSCLTHPNSVNGAE